MSPSNLLPVFTQEVTQAPLLTLTQRTAYDQGNCLSIANESGFELGRILTTDRPGILGEHNTDFVLALPDGSIAMTLRDVLPHPRSQEVQMHTPDGAALGRFVYSTWNEHTPPQLVLPDGRLITCAEEIGAPELNFRVGEGNQQRTAMVLTYSWNTHHSLDTIRVVFDSLAPYPVRLALLGTVLSIDLLRDELEVSTAHHNRQREQQFKSIFGSNLRGLQRSYRH